MPVNVPQLSSGFRPVSADIKPVQPMGLGAMSLGDIVNMGATMQAYEKQKELMPYQISEAKAKSESQQLQTAAQKQEAIGASFISRINNPLIVAAEANPDSVDRQALVKNIEQWGKQQGKDLGLDPETTAQLTAPYLQIAMENPGQLRSYLKERHIAGLDQGARTQATGIMPTLTTAGGQPALFNPATGQITQPQVGGAPQGGQTPQSMAPQGAPTGVTPGMMSQSASQQQQQGIRLNFPVRPAGDVRPFAPGEAEEAAAGQKYVQGLNDFGINAVSYKRNVDEVLAEAKKLEQSYGPTSGILGAARRKVATWAGDPTYTQLSKDLANVQIAALKAAGADLQTDAGKQLVRMANGDETFPPEVLINIANRTKADITNVELQRQAANKFYQRYGTNNMGSFKQAWADNADSKVFQAMNIYRDENLNGDEKKAMIDKLLGKNESDRKAFYQKYQNLNKLVNTGGL
jgi:hypothetical protein